jgi:hypothetical protein
MMNYDSAEMTDGERRRRDGLVIDLIETATAGAMSDEAAASALMRSAATLISRRVGEHMACDLMLAALVEARASLHDRRRAH